jgi:AraC-like DNA-binding protein
LQTTGMSQTQVFQVQRAWQAEALLRQGIPILDVVDRVGYSDQPHLTRSLKQLVGYTPSQVFSQPAPV